MGPQASYERPGGPVGNREGRDLDLGRGQRSTREELETWSSLGKREGSARHLWPVLQLFFQAQVSSLFLGLPFPHSNSLSRLSPPHRAQEMGSAPRVPCCGTSKAHSSPESSLHPGRRGVGAQPRTAELRLRVKLGDGPMPDHHWGGLPYILSSASSLPGPAPTPATWLR